MKRPTSTNNKKQTTLHKYFKARKHVPANIVTVHAPSDTNNLTAIQNDQRDQSFNNNDKPTISTVNSDESNNNSEDILPTDENDHRSSKTSIRLTAECDGRHNNSKDITMSTDEIDQSHDTIEQPTISITERDRCHNGSEETEENDPSHENSEEHADLMECDVDPQIVYAVQGSHTNKRPANIHKGAGGSNNTSVKLKAIELEFLNTTIKQSYPVKHLLNAESQQLLEDWESVGEDGKKIISHLYWRGKDLQRIELIQYYGGQKIINNNNQQIINKLLQKGFITSAPLKGEVQLDIDSYIRLLSLTELKSICKSLQVDQVDSKSSISNALKEYNRFKDEQYNTEIVFKRLHSSLKACYKLSDSARSTFHELNVLMHLGILGMDRSEDPTKKISNRPSLIIKSDVIIKSYPVPKNVKVDDASILFQTRDEFLRYLKAYDNSEKYFSLRQNLKLTEKKKAKKIGVANNSEEQDDTDKMKEELKHIILQTSDLYENLKNEHKLRYTEFCPWLWRFMPENIYLEIIDDGAEWLKEQKENQHALKLLNLLIQQKSFRQHKKGQFYKDKTNILEKNKDYTELVNTLLEAFKAAISDDDKNVLRPLAAKFSARREINDEIRRELRDFGKPSSRMNDLYLNNDKVRANNQKKGEAKLRPEHYCIKHYKQKEGFANGEHFEDRLMPTIFSLLFWDIIYTKPMGVNGIFMSHYQQYPLDMFSEEFYQNRKIKITERLTTIETSSEEQIIKMMHESWNKLPQYNVSVVTRKVKWEHVVGVTQCLGGRALAAICNRLARNYSNVYWGLPDLILWDVDTKKIKFREVKTTRDTLKLKQLQWLTFLKDQGLDAGVCYLFT